MYTKKIVATTLVVVVFLNMLPTAVFGASTPRITPRISCGSLSSSDFATHLGTEIDSRLTGLASSTSLRLFTTRGTSTGSTWVRNPDAWSATGSDPIDFTGISFYHTPSESHAPYQRAGTLISPKHVAFATHWPLSAGESLTFIDNDNVVYSRTLGTTTSIGNDITIGVLTEDVPSSIKYYPIVSSSTLAKKMGGNIVSGTDPSFNMPMVMFDQEAKALVRQAYTTNISSYLFFSSTYALNHTTYSSSTLPQRTAFSEPIVAGDSGQPAFFIVDGQPVFTFTHTFDSAGPIYGQSIAAINTAMTAMGGGNGYQVTEYDLDCFASNQAPTFTDPLAGFISVDVEESTTTPKSLYTFSAFDPNGGQVTYSLHNASTSIYSISTTTGELRLVGSPSINDDNSGTDQFQVRAYSDGGTGGIPFYNQRNVLSYISDVENSPVFASSTYTFSLAENSPVGTAVGTISAVDPDFGESTFYTIVSGNLNDTFAISSTTGAITVNAVSTLDYESRQTFTLQVMATSTPSPIPQPSILLGLYPNFATTTVTINLTDVSDTVISSGGGSGGGFSGGGGGGGYSSGGATQGVIYNSTGSSTPTRTSTPTSLLTLTNTAGLLLNANQSNNSVNDQTLNSAAKLTLSSLKNVNFNRNATLKTKSEDVKNVQKYLNAKGFSVSLTGVGSLGNESTFFGLKTKTALIRFQKSVGITPASGFLGPLTRAYILKDLKAYIPN